MPADRDLLSRLPEACRNYLNGGKPEEIEAVISDFVGVARGKNMPWSKFTKEERVFLPTSIFYSTVDGAYVDMDIENQWMERDMTLRPCYDTARACPWAEEPTIQVIHDLVDSEGNDIPLAPRNVLKRVVALYEAEGWAPVVAPEMEFYLIQRNIDPMFPVQPPVGRTGRRVPGSQAYSMTAVEDYGKVIDDIYDFAEAQGIEIDTIIQESGPGQVEVNFIHGDPLALADQVFTFKRTLREAALRNDLYCTFMAKPMEDEPGSAMHIHQSVTDMQSGENIFNDAAGEATDLFHAYIGGLQTHMPKVVSLFAPYVNSYRRFIADEAAPINLEWGRDNRTTGLRIPISRTEARRIENRIVGMDANPYLAIAASLACGYLGMKEGLKPRPAIKEEAYRLPRALPRGLLEAVELFEGCPEITQVLGQEFCVLYKAIKRHEAEAFLDIISPWEREHLLLNV
ncbi:glutamine synthetase family protein [Paracoccaceae bacterium GXU_MW_L88]